MTSTLTRGPLPARVYWRRRLLVLAVALLLVVGLARLLGGGSDASDGRDAARLTDAPASTAPIGPRAVEAARSSGTQVGPSLTEGSRSRSKSGRKAAPASRPPLAEPSGPCVDRDVRVVPEVVEAVAGPGNGVRIDLELRTVVTAACTWRVSPQTLTLKITSGRDDIWSSRQCPRAVPVQDVTVRRDAGTKVTLEWNAKRSDEDCSRLAGWAEPGWYHVAAAALAGEPTEVQFELEAPVAATVTASPEAADREGRGRRSAERRSSQPTGQPTDQPTGEPSGAVEPDSTSR